MKRAGIAKAGRRASATRVICQERISIVVSTMATLITLPTTEDRMSVIACWAPMTSLFRRLTRAPVWVRVKNASGIRWTWA